MKRNFNSPFPNNMIEHNQPDEIKLIRANLFYSKQFVKFQNLDQISQYFWTFGTIFVLHMIPYLCTFVDIYGDSFSCLTMFESQLARIALVICWLSSITTLGSAITEKLKKL
jgi:hypothetical protein